jgi:hypothetical protein
MTTILRVTKRRYFSKTVVKIIQLNFATSVSVSSPTVDSIGSPRLGCRIVAEQGPRANCAEMKKLGKLTA